MHRYLTLFPYIIFHICAGVVAAACMHGLVCFRVMRSSSATSAACFITLVLGVVGGGMLPGMHRTIVYYSPTPPQLFAPLPLPLLWVFEFLTAPYGGDLGEQQQQQQHVGSWLPPRLGICLYWVVSLVVFLPASEYICQQYSRYIPQIASRKLFHFLSVAMFTPIVLMDADMMFLAFSVALCALLLIEYFR